MTTTPGPISTTSGPDYTTSGRTCPLSLTWPGTYYCRPKIHAVPASPPLSLEVANMDDESTSESEESVPRLSQRERFPRGAHTRGRIYSDADFIEVDSDKDSSGTYERSDYEGPESPEKSRTSARLQGIAAPVRTSLSPDIVLRRSRKRARSRSPEEEHEGEPWQSEQDGLSRSEERPKSYGKTGTRQTGSPTTRMQAAVQQKPVVHKHKNLPLTKRPSMNLQDINTAGERLSRWQRKRLRRCLAAEASGSMDCGTDEAAISASGSKLISGTRPINAITSTPSVQCPNNLSSAGTQAKPATQKVSSTERPSSGPNKSVSARGSIPIPGARPIDDMTSTPPSARKIQQAGLSASQATCFGMDVAFTARTHGDATTANPPRPAVKTVMSLSQPVQPPRSVTAESFTPWLRGTLPGLTSSMQPSSATKKVSSASPTNNNGDSSRLARPEVSFDASRSCPVPSASTKVPLPAGATTSTPSSVRQSQNEPLTTSPAASSSLSSCMSSETCEPISARSNTSVAASPSRRLQPQSRPFPPDAPTSIPSSTRLVTPQSEYSVANPPSPALNAPRSDGNATLSPPRSAPPPPNPLLDNATASVSSFKTPSQQSNTSATRPKDVTSTSGLQTNSSITGSGSASPRPEAIATLPTSQPVQPQTDTSASAKVPLPLPRFVKAGNQKVDIVKKQANFAASAVNELSGPDIIRSASHASPACHRDESPATQQVDAPAPASSLAASHVEHNQTAIVQRSLVTHITSEPWPNAVASHIEEASASSIKVEVEEPYSIGQVHPSPSRHPPADSVRLEPATPSSPDQQIQCEEGMTESNPHETFPRNKSPGRSVEAQVNTTPMILPREVNPVEEFLKDCGLPVVHAEILRELGIKDAAMMRIIGLLPEDALAKLEDKLEDKGLDFATRLVIMTRLKICATTTI